MKRARAAVQMRRRAPARRPAAHPCGRILVVEDNPLSRALLRELLEHRGHIVSEAEDVPSARDALRGRLPDAILLDVQLPGGGGEALVREIRADARTRRLAVIAVTAFAMPGDRERLIAAGFDEYVTKPVDTRSLGPLVESRLAGPDVCRNGGRPNP